MIGVGLRGNLLGVAHQPGRGSVVVGICDLDADLAQRRAKELDLSPWTTTNWREVLAANDVDAVIVATPDFTHEELVIGSLEAGKATFAEKPLAITTQGCESPAGESVGGKRLAPHHGCFVLGGSTPYPFGRANRHWFEI